MLNINQNFDLKAPVFNFDRDYFNSVEELKAYDTSNVPNHFVTNVAGTLYQFTGGNWLPMIGTDYDADNQMQTLKIANENCLVQLLPSQHLYQYGVTTPYSAAVMNSWAQVVLYSESEDIPPYLKITLTDRINYSKSILCGQDDSAFGLTIKDLSNHSASMFIDEDHPNGSSPVGITLIDNDSSTKINAQDGFVHKTDDGYFSLCNSSGFDIHNTDRNKHTSLRDCVLNFQKNTNQLISLQSSDINSENSLIFGSDNKFKISRPINNTKGATITGVESITAFANPSATKVWATDGSTANMPTKFSDLANDSIYIKGNKGETDAKFKIEYKDGDVLRSKLLYVPRHAGVGIPELALVSYDTSGHNLSQLRIRPDDNRDNGQYLIQVQDVIGDTINYVSTIATENVSLQNFKNNTSVDLKSDELIFYNDPNGEQIQLKINKEGITKTGGKSTEVFATDGSIADLSTKANSSDVLLAKDTVALVADAKRTISDIVSNGEKTIILAPTQINSTKLDFSKNININNGELHIKVHFNTFNNIPSGLGYYLMYINDSIPITVYNSSDGSPAIEVYTNERLIVNDQQFELIIYKTPTKHKLEYKSGDIQKFIGYYFDQDIQLRGFYAAANKFSYTCEIFQIDFLGIKASQLNNDCDYVMLNEYGELQTSKLSTSYILFDNLPRYDKHKTITFIDTHGSTIGSICTQDNALVLPENTDVYTDTYNEHVRLYPVIKDYSESIYKIVDELPDTEYANLRNIYMIKKTNPTDSNVNYDKYICVSEDEVRSWEKIG